MFTIRTVGGVALFLFGTTFLWLTPMFASPGISTRGAWWAVTQVLALAVLAGFTLATYGLFTRLPWWETVALTSAVLGLIVLVPYWVAAQQAGEVTPWFNALIHALGSAGVLVLLGVPALERWVDGHVVTGA
ncbi:hypothetical protein [Actinomycetospora lemnae]|uniref:SPW repeat-containing protein n=1 Tax=Actinomycetospora lemnae TaxID=3019891 RepID=A0ABT5T0B7_9PSEU|nr:hypothetical protein [Actinomycetospora sp. DW7H6]MDD7968135.1 hypothetical protein [Actinomycetospora sp. DW7H6]